MSDLAISATPFTSAGLSGSAGSAAMRSHSTRSADCACAGSADAASASIARQSPLAAMLECVALMIRIATVSIGNPAVTSRARLRCGSRLADQFQRRRQPQAALAGEGGSLEPRAVLVAGACKTDADLVAAEHRHLALRRRVLLVEHLALPAAVRRRVAAEIVEERVAAEDAAVMQQHHAVQPAVDAVERAQVHRVEAVGNAAFADRAEHRRALAVDAPHLRAEHGARHLRRGALEAVAAVDDP